MQGNVYTQKKIHVYTKLCVGPGAKEVRDSRWRRRKGGDRDDTSLQPVSMDNLRGATCRVKNFKKSRWNLVSNS